jgi:phenylacetate-coenzyme A ligase PaaK-like adenylate-forming protein
VASTCSRPPSRGWCGASLQIEVFKDGELDEVRVLIELDDASGVSQVREALRATLGIRLEVCAVPARSLPRFDLKARRVVRK